MAWLCVLSRSYLGFVQSLIRPNQVKSKIAIKLNFHTHAQTQTVKHINNAVIKIQQQKHRHKATMKHKLAQAGTYLQVKLYNCKEDKNIRKTK